MSSSISALNNSSYYQLSDLGAGAGGNTAQSPPTDSLLQALTSSSADQATSSSSDAYLLDLSPEAQQYMNSSSSAASALSGSSTSSTFTLSAKQEQEITAILEKYKNSPQDQATFDAIQNALQAAGLDPATLSRIDQAQSFNPTQLLIDDLNGDTSGADSLMQPDESTKASNYMQQIAGEWAQISGNTGTSSATTTSSGSSSSTTAAGSGSTTTTTAS